MIVVCAWCKKKLGEKPPLDDRRVSHGLCQDCFAVQQRDVDDYWREICGRAVPAADSAAG